MAASNPDTQIVKAAIYPPIGIARVGNSEDEFFLAPEVPDPLPEKPGFYRDAEGALKRQAARFRIYAFGPLNIPCLSECTQTAPGRMQPREEP